jgi:hypothetical protein
MNGWIDTDAQANVVGYKQIHIDREINGWMGRQMVGYR